MNTKNQKRLAAKMLGVGIKRVVLDSSKLPEIKGAITKTDLRSLIAAKSIKTKPKAGYSRSNARKILVQKRKGKRKGRGSQRGRKTARLSRKRSWVTKIRSQRRFIKSIKEKGLISNKRFREVYSKIKGNRFRSIRLIKIYLEENKLIEKNAIQKKTKKENRL